MLRSKDAGYPTAFIEMDTTKEKIISISALNASFKKCRRGKMWKRSVQDYDLNMIRYNYILHNRLSHSEYQAAPCSVFQIREPKLRTIQAPALVDRIVQKSVMDHYLTAETRKYMAKESYACQIGKGTDRAREALKENLRRYYRKHGREGYVLKIDIKSYFGTIDQETLTAINERYIKQKWIRHVVQCNAAPTNGDTGLGLGSETNQEEALLYLTRADTYIKYVLGCKYYVRYMDDMILILTTRQEAREVLEKIETMLKGTLKLSVNRKKTQIYRIQDHYTFLGFRFTLTDTGKALMQICKSNVKDEKRKLKKQFARMDLDEVEQCFYDWKNHAAKGDNYFIVKRMEGYFMNRMAKEREKEKERERQAARVEQLIADMDYMAMMTDVELLGTEEKESESEAAENEQ